MVFVLSTVSLHAMGSRESSLEEAERLIEEGREVEAVKILTRIIRENPDLELEAQELISRLRRKRLQTLLLQEQLFVAQDNNDYERMLEIIEKLKENVQHLTESQKQWVRDAESLAELERSRILFDQIMTRGLEQIINEEYAGAVQTYLPGYEFFKDDFDSADYPDITKASVNNTLAKLFDSVQRFTDNKSVYDAMFNQLQAAVDSGSPSRLTESIDQYRTRLAGLSELRLEIYKAYLLFTRQRQFLDAQKEEGLTDFFLQYAQLFTAGRSDTGRPEGVDGAVYTYINSRYRQITGQLGASIDGGFQTAWQLLDEGTYNQANAIKTETDSLIESFTQLYSFWLASGILTRAHSLGGFEPEDRMYVLESYAGTILKYKSLQNMVLFKQYKENLASYEGFNTQSTGEIRSQVIEIRAAFDDFSGFVQRQQDLQQKVMDVNSVNFVYEDLLEKNRELTRRLEQLRESSVDIRKRGMYAIIQRDFEELKQAYNTLAVSVDEGIRLLNGLVETDEGSRQGRPYPDRALLIFQDSNDVLERYIVRVESFIDEYTNEPVEIRTYEPYSLVLDEAVDLTARARTQVADIQRLITESRKRIAEADRLEREGRQYFERAESAANNGNFEQANNLLEEGAVTLNNSLDTAEDAGLRQFLENEYQRLTALIFELWDQQVIRVVRRLIGEARGQFFNGNFDEAESLLVEADNEWKKTRDGTFIEITDLLGRVRNAQKSNEGIVIVKSHPLYDDMARNFNNASELYEEGLALYNKGNDAYRSKLSNAVQYLNMILDQFYYNQAARILRLKIIKLLDVNDYDRQIADMYQQASVAVQNENYEQAYPVLRNIIEMEPDYRNIQAVFRQTQIGIGLIQPEPDPGDIARARNLYTQAKLIRDNRRSAEYQNAIGYCNQALELYPQFSAAENLLYELIAVSGRNRIPPSPEVLAQFREAFNLWKRRAYFQAQVIVEELWQDEANRTYKPLADLKANLDQRLGTQ